MAEAPPPTHGLGDILLRLGVPALSQQEAFRHLRTIEECLGTIGETMAELSESPPPANGWASLELRGGCERWSDYTVDRLRSIIHTERERVENT